MAFTAELGQGHVVYLCLRVISCTTTGSNGNHYHPRRNQRPFTTTRDLNQTCTGNYQDFEPNFGWYWCTHCIFSSANPDKIHETLADVPLELLLARTSSMRFFVSSMVGTVLYIG